MSRRRTSFLVVVCALVALTAGCQVLPNGPEPEPGEKRFDRFACFNLSAEPVDFKVLLHRDGAPQPEEYLIHVEPGQMGGCVLIPDTTAVARTVECHIQGQPNHVILTTALPNGLRSATFWWGHEGPVGSPKRLCGSGLNANEVPMAVVQD